MILKHQLGTKKTKCGRLIKDVSDLLRLISHFKIVSEVKELLSLIKTFEIFDTSAGRLLCEIL